MLQSLPKGQFPAFNSPFVQHFAKILSLVLGACVLGIPACAVDGQGNVGGSGFEGSVPAQVVPFNPAPAPRAASQYNSAHTARRVIALTFDDGPHPDLTPKLLDILRQNGVRATFFVVGRNVKAYPEIARRIVAEGHEIANHSWSHPALPKLGAAGLRHEIENTNAVIESVTGRRPTNMRPPYGALNPRVRDYLTKGQNMNIILWSVDPLDWKRPGAQVVTQRLVEGATPGGILLAHDIHPGTVEAMPDVIAQLKAKGYGFATVGQLLALQDYGDSALARTQESTASHQAVY